MEKIKVLIIQSKIMHYRVPIFNKIAEDVDLTVMYDSGNVPEGIKFNVIKSEVKDMKHLFTYHKKFILPYANKFDVTIMMFDPSYLTTKLLAYLKRKTKLVFWGIGVAASRNMRYDGCQKTAKILSKLIKKSDAALFYADYPVKKYSQMGIECEKLFVAPNTVEVLPIEEKERKNILFIGTLYKQKKIFELLECYLNAYKKNENTPKLTIIGDGEEYQNIKNWILANEMQDNIELTGAVFDENILAEHFSKALMCISPDQAGLSVLKSFGYGVPFITHKDAITGGERHNIVDGETGILLESFDVIEDIILDCSVNPQKYIEMGKQAKQHYMDNHKVSDMAKGFIDAINYVMQKDNKK